LATLRAVVIIDYQNIYLTGHDLFPVSKALAPHEDLVHPLYFSQQLIASRNQAQKAAAKIETCSWFDPAQPRRSRQIRPHGRRIWNTRLTEAAFMNSWDRSVYS